MKTPDFDYFQKKVKQLESHLIEYKRVNEAFNKICQGSVVELGNELVDAYIEAIETMYGINDNMLSWFVFDNDFGSKKYTFKLNDFTFHIDSYRKFYDICIVEYNKA